MTFLCGEDRVPSLDDAEELAVLVLLAEVLALEGCLHVARGVTADVAAVVVHVLNKASV